MLYFKGERNNQPVLVTLDEQLIRVYSNGKIFEKNYKPSRTLSQFCQERFKVTIDEEIDEITFSKLLKTTSNLVNPTNFWTTERIQKRVNQAIKDGLESGNLEAELLKTFFEIENPVTNLDKMALQMAARELADFETHKSHHTKRSSQSTELKKSHKTVKKHPIPRLPSNSFFESQADFRPVSKQEQLCQELLSVLSEMVQISQTTYQRILNVLTRTFHIAYPMKLVDSVINEKSDLIQEARICYLLDQLILIQSSRVSIGEAETMIAQTILSRLGSISVCKKGPTPNQLIKYIDLIIKEKFFKEKLQINNKGIRLRSIKDIASTEDYSLALDGSLGDNNYIENGRFVSSASFDRMDDESMS